MNQDHTEITLSPEQYALLEAELAAQPSERYRSPGRRGDARQPRRVLAQSRFNRKLWQSLEADARAMTPDERERVGMPRELPAESEPDRTPARHGKWMNLRERRALTRDLKRARMEDQAKLAARATTPAPETSNHDQVIQDAQPARAL